MKLLNKGTIVVAGRDITRLSEGDPRNEAEDWNGVPGFELLEDY